MHLIIGLGNPEKKYEKTRHNIGHEVVAAFAKERECAPWKTEKRLYAEVSNGRVGTENIALAIPTVYMNESGRAVRAIVSQVKCQLSEVIIVHDDIDLPLGMLRFSFGASSGGQRGVESIIEALGTKEFARLRIGVAGATRNRTDAAAYVLKPFSRTEQKTVAETKKRAVKALAEYIQHGLDHARSIFNTKEKGAS